MKSTVRIKKINGKEYWYEDVPYYDKEKKQIRHRSKYIRKNVNGSPIRMRSTISFTPHASYWRADPSSQRDKRAAHR